ncbi:transporter [Thioalkalivibrio sp.]|uniref:SphA family protein n=1 Tax=Thioalkalivibrio sp. TaxID=2093813 RepID=UPI0035658898
MLSIWRDLVIAAAGLTVLLRVLGRARRRFLLGLVIGLAPFTSAGATEGGGSVYPYGLNTVATGVLPPPGHHLYLYNLYYTADRAVDGDGRDAVPDFQLDVRAHTLRYLGVLDTQILGGRPAWLLAQPFIDGDLEVGPFGDGRRGLGDTTTGIMLGWKRPHSHVIAGLDLTLPTGAYSTTRAFNPGRNHFAGTFYYSLTRPFAEHFDANLRVNLTVNARNPDTRYRSGVESGADYSLNRRFGSRWLAGVNGYVQYQLTDDKLRGEQVAEDGRRLRVFAIGPQVAYRGDGWGIVGKWQRETGARNRAEGDRFWLQMFWRL